MSKVALSGNALGSGTLTIAAPNTSTDRTLNLPDASGTILTTATPGVPVNGPAFSAYLSASQTGISNSTWTKVALNAEDFDTASCFDTATGRFTPTVAGYYLISAAITHNAATANPTNASTAIYKNGAIYRIASLFVGAGTVASVLVAEVVYLNGSTDFVEMYGYMVGATGGRFDSAINGGTTTHMSGFLARSAT